MKRKIHAEHYSFHNLPEGHNLDDPYLPTGVDLKPEVHPRDEIQFNASLKSFKLNAAKRLLSSIGRTKASIMPSNQAPINDTHISSVEDEEENEE